MKTHTPRLTNSSFPWAVRSLDKNNPVQYTTMECADWSFCNYLVCAFIIIIIASVHIIIVPHYSFKTVILFGGIVVFIKLCFNYFIFYMIFNFIY